MVAVVGGGFVVGIVVDFVVDIVEVEIVGFVVFDIVVDVGSHSVELMVK